MNDLFAALSGSDYDVVVFTETWLNETVLDAELADEYKIYRCDRSSSTSQFQRGGGVLIGIKRHIQSNVVTTDDADQLEQMIVRVDEGNRALFVCTIYLPPNTEPYLYERHGACIHEVCNRMKNRDRMLLLGDYNLPFLHWSFDEDIRCFIPTNASSEQELTLIESIVASGLKQINHLTNQNGRLLDLAFVDDTEESEIFEPPLPLMKVDRHHKPFVVKLAAQISFAEHGEVFYRDFSQCNFDDLNTKISSINWSAILSVGTVDDAVCSFYQQLNTIIDMNVPLRKRRKQLGNTQPWWNGELRNLRNRLRKARKRYFKLRSDDHKATVRELERQFTSLNQSRFRTYIFQLENDFRTNPQNFFSHIRNRTSNNGIPQNLFYKETTSATPAESANLFSSFFQSVLSNNIPPLSESYLSELQTYDLNLPFILFSEEDVCTKLSNLDASKGAGPDNLQTSFIKQCCSSLALPSSLLFNRSVSEGCFPTLWKLAAITPVHKAGNIHDVLNYRGISILNCLPKVFESLLLDVIYPSVHHIIEEEQHGFVKKRSTNTNLMTYVSTLMDNIEKRQQTDAIYVDFSKAFDRVPHDLAVEKLRRFGFPIWLVNWIHSYLTGRSAYVRVGTSFSEQFSVTSGLPQGSHLGPFLFVLFVHDLCSVIKSLKMMYADDLKFFRVITSIVDCCALQMDINALLDWCNKNAMEVNIKKCNVVTFGRLHSPIIFEYVINNVIVDRVTSIKDLGVILDCKLRFSEHISSVTAKAFAVVGIIRRNTQSFTDIYCLKALYVSLVRSILEYAVAIWAPYHAVHIDRLERVQRSFIRFALRQLPWRNRQQLPPYESRCALISLPTLQKRRQIIRQLLIFDLMDNKLDCPSLLSRLNLNAPGRSMRRTGFFRRGTHRTQYGQHNPIEECCQLFNEVYHLYDFDLSRNVFRLRISF